MSALQSLRSTLVTLFRSKSLAGESAAAAAVATRLKVEDLVQIRDLVLGSKGDAESIGAEKDAANADALLDRQAFGNICQRLGVSEDSRISALYDNMDKDHDHKVSFRELTTVLTTLVSGTNEAAVEFEFSLWDRSGDGNLDREEFSRYIVSTSRANGSLLSNEALKRISNDLFTELDLDGNESIDLAEFKKGVLKVQTATGVSTNAVAAADEINPSERSVYEFLGSRMPLSAGDVVKAATMNKEESSFFFIAKGKATLTYRGIDVHSGDGSKPKSAMLGVCLAVLPNDQVAVRADTDCELIEVPVTSLSELALNGHAGAVVVYEHIGKIMYDMIEPLDNRVAEAFKNGEKDLAENLQEWTGYLRDAMRDFALQFHSIGSKGKIAVQPTKSVGDSASLSIAYSPGVAEPCLAIKENPDLSYEYTSRGHLVGVISNGTAVLGLGNIGALASKPVMEGKAVLFKTFGGVDSFDIEVDESDPDKFIEHVVAIAPTFGGINLEDIKAPECFYIEPEIQRRVSIPIMHDDQHGTAIIAGAGLVNALHFAEKDIGDVKIVVNGCGAAGYTVARHFIALGVKPENLVACDIDGVVYKGRKDLEEDPNLYLHNIATTNPARTLAEAVEGADAFVGLSVPNILTPEMLLSMKKSPLIFALANPTPEIRYALAKATRPDVIMGTGRSDLPNQINNVCAFPFIFRGALDCRASAINEEMKMATTHAIADLAKTDPTRPFSPESIIPLPRDPRLLYHIAPAIVEAAQKTGVARMEVNVDEYRAKLEREVKVKMGDILQ